MWATEENNTTLNIYAIPIVQKIVIFLMLCLPSIVILVLTIWTLGQQRVIKNQK